MSSLIVDHRDSTLSRRLRRRRGQLAVAIAIVEAILVLVGVLPWWLAVVAAVASVAVYVWVGRDHGSPVVREAAWVAAVSQLIVVLVPVAVVVVGVLALVALVLLAAGALAVLLLDRH
jgi:hypothetical protein